MKIYIGHVSPEAAVGGPIALVEEGDIIRINIPEMKLEIAVSDEEMAARKAKWQPREPKVTTGYLKRYASLVTSGNRGAILALPEETEIKKKYKSLSFEKSYVVKDASDDVEIKNR